MDIDTGAAQEAAVSLFHNLGPLDDLPEELRNTLANVYYRFFALSRNLQDPSKVLGYDDSDAMSTFKGFTEGSAEVLAAFRTAKGMVRALREVRNERSDLYEYLVVLTLDLLKYRIPDADQKTPVRRAIERKLRKPPSEIAGLYDGMALGRRLEEEKPKPVSCVPLASKLPFPQGAQVEHPKFGLGSVLSSDGEHIVIKFDEFGVKHFVASIVLPNLKKSDRGAEAIAKTQQVILNLAQALIKAAKPDNRDLIVSQKRLSLEDERLMEQEKNAEILACQLAELVGFGSVTRLPKEPTREELSASLNIKLAVIIPELRTKGA